MLQIRNNVQSNDKMRLLLTLIILFCLNKSVVSLAQNSTKSAEKPWKDPTPHNSYQLKINGINLNILDWGGEQKTVLIMVHGLGESPHIFDDLSSKLNQNFRLIAYAKRGQGNSDNLPPYNTQTDVEDLRQLLKALNMKKVNLLVRARGGNEVTAFTEKYPEMVDKLIYLDAYFDWSDLQYAKAFADLPTRIYPIKENFLTMHTYGSFYHHLWLPFVKWTDGLSAHVQNITYIGSDSLVHTKPNETTLIALENSLKSYHRNYRKIKVPVLVLLAADFMKTDSKDSLKIQKFADWNTKYILPWKEQTLKRIKTEIKDLKIVEIPNVTNASIGVIELENCSKNIINFIEN
jgi:pimeloyl-ACP methyl ester carboxylesterase